MAELSNKDWRAEIWPHFSIFGGVRTAAPPSPFSELHRRHKTTTSTALCLPGLGRGVGSAPCGKLLFKVLMKSSIRDEREECRHEPEMKFPERKGQHWLEVAGDSAGGSDPEEESAGRLRRTHRW